MELFGRVRRPVTARFVVVALVLVVFPNVLPPVKTWVPFKRAMLAPFERSVEARERPEMVAPVRFNEPETARFVVALLVEVAFVLVELVEVRFVTVRALKERPETVAPVKSTRPVAVRLVEETLVEVRFVEARFVVVAFVVVTFVKTPVEGVMAPIGVLSMVPPLTVSASAMFPSAREPVMEPKEPRARVTEPLPRVPELMAVAETEPVASIVRPFTTKASVMELFGRERPVETTRLVVEAFVEARLVEVAATELTF